MSSEGGHKRGVRSLWRRLSGKPKRDGGLEIPSSMLSSSSPQSTQSQLSTLAASPAPSKVSVAPADLHHETHVPHSLLAPHHAEPAPTRPAPAGAEPAFTPRLTATPEAEPEPQPQAASAPAQLRQTEPDPFRSTVLRRASQPPSLLSPRGSIVAPTPAQREDYKKQAQDEFNALRRRATRTCSSDVDEMHTPPHSPTRFATPPPTALNTMPSPSAASPSPGGRVASRTGTGDSRLSQAESYHSALSSPPTRPARREVPSLPPVTIAGTAAGAFGAAGAAVAAAANTTPVSPNQGEEEWRDVDVGAQRVASPTSLRSHSGSRRHSVALSLSLSKTRSREHHVHTHHGSHASHGSLHGSHRHHRARRHHEQKASRAAYVHGKSKRVQALSAEQVAQSDEELRDDLKHVRHALELFFNSEFDESERILQSNADSRMYYALGEAFVAFLKACMGFEDEDIQEALSHCKDTMHIVQLVRKGTGHSGVTGSVTGGITSVGRFVLNGGSGVRASSLVQMSQVQRHAELVHAETLLLRSVLSILSSGDVLGLMSETLHLRSVYASYRSLLKFLEAADEKKGRGSRAQRSGVDEDFRSGVYLGNGLLSIILGMLPGKVLKAMEVVGYTGDCVEGLRLLNLAGGWSPTTDDEKEGLDWDLATIDPHAGISAHDDGLRRILTDQLICAYHLIFANFAPLPAVNLPLARRIVAFNLQRFPNGFFPCYFVARLRIAQAQPQEGIDALQRSLDVQDRYVQFQHMILWDMCLSHLSLGQWDEALPLFKQLLTQTNWSKAGYNYSVAVCLYESYAAAHPDERTPQSIIDTMAATPEYKKKMAGKSVPMDKFVVRKSEQFVRRGGYQPLMGIELAYIFQTFKHTPVFTIQEFHLPHIDRVLATLTRYQNDPSKYPVGGTEAAEQAHLDDLALALFLRGVCLRIALWPLDGTVVRRSTVPSSTFPFTSSEETDRACDEVETLLHRVVALGPSLSDAWLMYYATFELGNFYAAQGLDEQAREQFDTIISGRNLGDKRRGKYSLQTSCMVRSNGALSQIKQKEKARRNAA